MPWGSNHPRQGTSRSRWAYKARNAPRVSPFTIRIRRVYKVGEKNDEGPLAQAGQALVESKNVVGFFVVYGQVGTGLHHASVLSESP